MNNYALWREKACQSQNGPLILPLSQLEMTKKIEKVQAAVAPSTCRVKMFKIQLGQRLEVDVEKVHITLLCREANVQVKMYKEHTFLGPLLEVEMLQEYTSLRR